MTLITVDYIPEFLQSIILTQLSKMYTLFNILAPWDKQQHFTQPLDTSNIMREKKKTSQSIKKLQNGNISDVNYCDHKLENLYCSPEKQVP